MGAPTAAQIAHWRTLADGAFLPASVVSTAVTSFAECTAPVNIAVVKYWGKRDEKLILPINSSLSATLHQDDLATHTLILASPDFTEDAMWLNGAPESLAGARTQACLAAVRARAAPELQHAKVHIWTHNNFPTAAGLASSASGFACLVFTLATALHVEESYPGEYSVWARQGSGSACRSLYGGYVKWEKGARADGADSMAVQVAPEGHWEDMHILVLVVNDAKKAVASTAGMETSVQTCELIQARIECADRRVKEMEDAILQRNWNKVCFLFLFFMSWLLFCCVVCVVSFVVSSVIIIIIFVIFTSFTLTTILALNS
jgi:diphosphomevalonate decarboxylase